MISHSGKGRDGNDIRKGFLALSSKKKEVQL